MNERQLFILDDAIWDSMSFEDVRATIHDMRELKLAIPPCRYFDIMTKARVADLIQEHIVKDDERLGQKYYNDDMIWKFSFTEDLECMSADMMLKAAYMKRPISFLEDMFRKDGLLSHLPEEELKQEQEAVQGWVVMMAAWVLAYLLVALAAKNSVRTSKQNKLAKLGIGKKNPKNDYGYTTTVSIGKITETERTGDGSSGGWTVRPHLRRGHIRVQRYGPNNQHTKQVFIQPVFVNAVEGFVNNRTAYNVKVA